MLTSSEIQQAAEELLTAEATGTQIPLLTVRYPNMTLDDAYEIQAKLTDQKIWAGRSIVGWKIGLTSKAMQDALGITTPDSGVLFDDMIIESGSNIPKDRFIQPRVEAEIAFVMKSEIAGEVTRDEVLAATDYVVPSIEILDTRIFRKDPMTGAARKICDTVSDNAANAAVIVGTKRTDPSSVDLRRVGCILTKDREVVATGLGAAVLGDPVQGIVWLSKRLSQYNRKIEAGQIVLSGSFIAPVECPPNTAIDADFGSFGRVNIAFQ